MPRHHGFVSISFIVMLVVVGVCLRLSYWQLQRAQEKTDWISQLNERSAQPPQPLSHVLRRDDPQHVNVTFRGQADNERTVLLDNRIYQGRAGYFIYTPVRAEGDRWVLINRGWVARDLDRRILPDIPPLPDTITVTGTAYQHAARSFVLAEETLPDNQWPLRVQEMKFDTLGPHLGVDLAPFEIRVTELAPMPSNHDPLPRPWTIDMRMGPDHHKAYALQWFGLAIAALVIFIAARRHQRRLDRNEVS